MECVYKEMEKNQKFYKITDKKIGVSGIYSYPFDQLGMKSKKVFFIPVKDKNGISMRKYLRIVEGSQIYKKLLGSGTELPMCWIIEE